MKIMAGVPLDRIAGRCRRAIFAAVSSAVIVVQLLPARAADDFAVCAVQGSRLLASTSGAGTVAFDLLDARGHLLGRQLVLSTENGHVDAPLLVPKQPMGSIDRVKCEIPSDVVYRTLGSSMKDRTLTMSLYT